MVTKLDKYEAYKQALISDGASARKLGDFEEACDAYHAAILQEGHVFDFKTDEYRRVISFLAQVMFGELDFDVEIADVTQRVVKDLHSEMDGLCGAAYDRRMAKDFHDYHSGDSGWKGPENV